jgi:hypothetical protein
MSSKEINIYLGVDVAEEEETPLNVSSLINARRSLVGSVISGIRGDPGDA